MTNDNSPSTLDPMSTFEGLAERFDRTIEIPAVRVIDSRFKPGLSEEFMARVHGAFGSNRDANPMDVSGIEHLVQLSSRGLLAQDPVWMSAEEWRKLVGIHLEGQSLIESFRNAASQEEVDG